MSPTLRIAILLALLPASAFAAEDPDQSLVRLDRINVFGNAAETVAMSDLDPWHTCLVGRFGDGDHLLGRDLVTLGMHAVAQAHFMKGDLASFDAHSILSSAARWQGEGAVGSFFSEKFSGAQTGRCHDVEVAGIFRQEVAKAFDL